MVFFVLFYPFLYYYSRKPERFLALNRVRRYYAFLSSALTGIYYKYHYQAPIDWSRSYIFCANHSSNLDISAITIFNKANFAFMGKDELLDNPVTALFFKTIDIPLKRESKMSSFRAFKKAEEYLKRGMSLAIFPEGKIAGDYPPLLHPFKNGPFRLAIEQKVPIIPISMTNLWEKMWDDGAEYGSSPGICHICVHAPVETSDLGVDDEEILKEKVYAIINSDLK